MEKEVRRMVDIDQDGVNPTAHAQAWVSSSPRGQEYRRRGA
jgi:hypothetical protein